MSPHLRLSFPTEALQDFNRELQDVEALAEREQLTTAEATDWASQAADDLIESVKLEPID